MDRRTFIQAAAAFFGLSKAGFEKPEEEQPIELVYADEPKQIVTVKPHHAILHLGSLGILLQSPYLWRVYKNGPREFVYLECSHATAPTEVMKKFYEEFGTLKSGRSITIEFEDQDRIEIKDVCISCIGVTVAAQEFVISEGLMLCGKVSQEHPRIPG